MAFHHKNWFRTIICIAVAVVLISPTLLAAKSDGTPSEETENGQATKIDEDEGEDPLPRSLSENESLVDLDFLNADIKEITKKISKLTGRNFLVDPSVSGNVNIVSTGKVTPNEAYKIYLSVLKANGYTTSSVGKITKIIPSKEAIQRTIPTRIKTTIADNDQVITQLLQLEHIDSNDIVNAFSNLVGSEGRIFNYGPSNMLFITDSSSNVKRLMKIILKLDTESSKQIVETIILKYANAETLADTILELLEEDIRKAQGLQRSYQRTSRRLARRRNSPRKRSSRSRSRSRRYGSTSVPTASPPVVLADTRTNALVVKTNAFQMERIKEIAGKLDQPLPGGEGKIHVLYLENADAQEMAETLAMLTEGMGGQSTSNNRNRNLRRNQRNPRNRLQQYLSRRLGGRGAMNSSMNRFGTTSGRLFADFDGTVRITADPATNSLVVACSARDLKIIQDIVAKLDITRKQVLVEAVILEVTMDNGLDFGFEFRSTNDFTEDGVQVIGGSNYGGIQEAAANPLGMSGFAIGAMDGTISYGGAEYPNIGALFRALQTDREVSVLSTPQILTMNNEEAEIIVADNVPFITGQVFSANNTNPTTTIERQDVGITLRILPQISNEDRVKLEIYQETSQVTDSPEGLTASQVGVTTSKRTAQTSVVAHDNQTIVIGGLLKDNQTLAEAKIPILGDVPIVGHLFKSSKLKNEKSNLLIFITPYIIQSASDLEQCTRVSNERLKIFQEQTHDDKAMNLGSQFVNDVSMQQKENVFLSPRTNPQDDSDTSQDNSQEQEDEK